MSKVLDSRGRFGVWIALEQLVDDRNGIVLVLLRHTFLCYFDTRSDAMTAMQLR